MLGKPSKKKFGESWDIVPTGRGGTLSFHISVPTEKITCSEWLRTHNKVIKQAGFAVPHSSLTIGWVGVKIWGC